MSLPGVSNFTHSCVDDWTGIRVPESFKQIHSPHVAFLGHLLVKATPVLNAGVRLSSYLRETTKWRQQRSSWELGGRAVFIYVLQTLTLTHNRQHEFYSEHLSLHFWHLDCSMSIYLGTRQKKIKIRCPWTGKACGYFQPAAAQDRHPGIVCRVLSCRMNHIKIRYFLPSANRLLHQTLSAALYKTFRTYGTQGINTRYPTAGSA